MKTIITAIIFISLTNIGFGQNLISNSGFETDSILNCSSWYDGCGRELTYLCDTLTPDTTCDVFFYKDVPPTGGRWSIGVTGVGNSPPSTVRTFVTGLNGAYVFQFNIWIKDAGLAWGMASVGTVSGGEYVLGNSVQADTGIWKKYSIIDTFAVQTNDSIQITLSAMGAGPTQGDIYFDQAELIITDTLTSVEQNNGEEKNAITIFTNPSGKTITVEIKAERNGPYRFTVYNSMGQLVKTMETDDNIRTLYIDDLARGSYFYQVQNLRDHTTTGRGSFIKE